MDSPIPPPEEEPVLEEILGRMAPRLKRIFLRYRIPPQDADDLLQETLLIMVSKSGSIRNLEAWLETTLANRCILFWRRQQSRIWEQVDTAILDLLADPEASTQEQEELRCDLDARLAELPDHCQALLRLRYGLGSSCAETGERLGEETSSTQRCLAALTSRLLGSGFDRDI